MKKNKVLIKNKKQAGRRTRGGKGHWGLHGRLGRGTEMKDSNFDFSLLCTSSKSTFSGAGTENIC